MLQDLGWPTLQQHREDSKLAMMYRIIHGLVYISPRFLQPNATCTGGHSQRYLTKFCRTYSRLHPRLPLGHQTLEPATRAYRHVRDSWECQEGSCHPTLVMYRTFYALSVTCSRLIAIFYIVPSTTMLQSGPVLIRMKKNQPSLFAQEAPFFLLLLVFKDRHRVSSVLLY